MTVEALVQLIKEFIKAAASGNYMASFMLLMTILQAIGQNLTPLMGSHNKGALAMRSDGDLAMLTEAELLARLDQCCDEYLNRPVMADTPNKHEHMRAVDGKFIDKVKPILAALFKLWFLV